ncbi:MAG: prevent-host-death protein [Deltaproteobacteria bacterium]|nr:prevent-host-death protein [Deltaproteobacteria bacterium]
MRAVGIKVLKNKLTEYVKLAAGGETILVTDRDQVVAELCAPRSGRSPMLADAQLAELVRQGILRPPLAVSKEPPPAGPRLPPGEFEKILVELRADRDSR